ncbi:pentatricopeptide repeat-containing protein [Striga asiatica]|uniref:Pentatricopeptide repeat-containing protein n=1 Tax=Striga asiatica TaxID=4170 RepID=A0A5A7QY47_STRAF|nr:pentatricopeptide repeat-containing protein [Striga asiatica]
MAKSSKTTVAQSLFLATSNGEIIKNHSHTAALLDPANIPSLDGAKSFHALVTTMGSFPNQVPVFLHNNIIFKYASLGEIDMARKMFDGMPQTNVVSYNTMIGCYGRAGSIHATPRGIFFFLPSPRSLNPQNLHFQSPSKLSYVTKMMKLALPYHHSFSPILTPPSTAVPNLLFPPNFHRRRRLIHLPVSRRSLSVIARSRKQFVYGNPSVTVEKGKYSYEVETLINNLSGLPPRGSISRCLEPFRNKLSLSDFTNVFREFAQRGDWQRSLRLFKHMQRHIWCKPNEHIYSLVIGILGREGLLDKSAEIFEEMEMDSVPRTVLSYTAIINTYGRNGQYEVALELLERMKKERVLPNILTYNTVINACARGGYSWEGLLSLFGEMRHEGIHPDLVTYNLLLGACASRGLGEEAEMVFRTMIESGVSPDINTYSCLVETFGKLGKLEKVSELLAEMEADGNLPEIMSYNVLLEAYANSGKIKEAMGVFRQMQAVGSTPNAGTFSILLNMFGKNGRYEDVRDLFLEMKVSNTEPDANTYNIMIDVFGEGGYFKEVVTLFHDMIEENVEPNMETYEGLIRACGKGGLYEDAKRILLHMNENGFIPSSKAYTGVIEAFGQAALYEEVVVALNTMNEIGSVPTIETYNTLIHAFTKGGLYKEAEAILSRMDQLGVPKNRNILNGMIEVYRQGGQFEAAIKAYVDLEKINAHPDEYTLESVLSVYCVAGLVDESELQFGEIKELVGHPSVMCYCMMLAVYANSDRLDKASELLNEMQTNKVSNIHQIIGHMIKGDYDDDSNWQMVEYVFDKLNSEGCDLRMRFYNTILEALWCLGQKERAARVLHEATKRGLYPELFRKNKRIWSVDVHRMWPGGACTAISVWLNNMQKLFNKGEELPQLATAIVVRGQMEKSSITRDFPVTKAAYSFLKDISSSFCLPGWNKGRIICQKPQLKRIFIKTEPSSEDSEIEEIVSLHNTPFPVLKARTSMSGLKQEKANKLSFRSVSELMASGV